MGGQRILHEPFRFGDDKVRRRLVTKPKRVSTAMCWRVCMSIRHHRRVVRGCHRRNISIIAQGGGFVFGHQT